MNQNDTSKIYGIVDMGSNGIRFSISDLSGPTARLIPTLYQSRSGISIYDAQFSGSPGQRVPIPEKTIVEIISTINSFVRTCHSFNVPSGNIRIQATEATRTAPNGVEFRDRVKAETGLNVNLLAKEDEGRIGALGIASSFPAPIRGIVLDLGGGSVQISWIRLDVGSEIQRSKSPVSMPYGAAAMMGRLANGMKEQELADEIEQSFRQALKAIEVPQDMLGHDGDGITLYLSGGGFRGWGYAQMDRHPIDPYPIPIINGLSLDTHYMNLKEVLAKGSSDPVTDDTFRISSRRADQAPAVVLLIGALLNALPKVCKINFAQGGVREGSLFSLLGTTAQSQHPLVAATAPFASVDVSKLASLIAAAIPTTRRAILPPFLGDSHSSQSFITSLASLLSYHSSCPKDIRPSAALRSTTTGILASTHGLTHESRAWLGLALLSRWGTTREDLPKTDLDFYDGLSKLIGSENAWWAGYIGWVAGVVGALYPSGTMPAVQNDFKWNAEWDTGKKGARVLLHVQDVEDGNVEKALLQLEKWGKKKKWDARHVEGYKIKMSGSVEDDSD